MKKALALILTVAMLLSCVSIGVSAARVYTAETVPAVVDHYASTGSESSMFVGVQYETPIGGLTDNYTNILKLRSRTDLENGKLGEIVSFFDGPVINMDTDTVGFVGASINYDFVGDTWYTIQYDVKDSSTDITINGEYVGTINDTPEAKLYGSFYRLDVSEITYLKDGSVVWSEDFEGSAPYAWDFEEVGLDVVSPESTVYNNVNDMSYEAADHYASTGSESSMFVGVQYESPIGGLKNNYTNTIVLRSRTDLEDGKLGEIVSFFDGLTLDMPNGQVGIVGGSVSYDFVGDTWYTIKYDVKDSTTDVYINGEFIGTINKAPEAKLYGSFYRLDVSKISYEADGEVVWCEDFEGSAPYAWDFEEVGYETELVAGNQYDLGMKHWIWDPEWAYVFTKLSNDAEFEVSMDICLDDAASNFAAYYGDCLTIDTTGVGISGNNLKYAFEVGEWYHLVLDTNGSATDVYVNDQYLGRISQRLNPEWCGGVNLISIDNLECDRYSEDFEDGEWQEKGDSNGYVTNYKFDVEEPEVVDPLAGLPKYEVGGDAVLLEANTGNNYMLMNLPTAAGNTGYISFDMAMIDNGYEDGLEGFEGAHSIEFWRYNNGGFSRFTAGEKVGRDTNLVDYEWGELSAENFHNVVIKYAPDENRGGTVYGYFFIDGVQVGAETGYNAYSSWPGDALIVNIWNSSVIIDNFYIYDADMNSIGDSFLNARDVTSDFDPKVVNLDYEGTYCEANGCIWGGISLKTAETCTSLGYDVLNCGECGEQIGEDIERPMLCHIFNKFDKYQISDGYYYVTCKDCNETRYSKVPSEAAYTGDITAYFDMSDDLFGKLRNEANCEILGSIEGSESYMGDNMRYENGKGVCDADSYVANYQPLPFGSILAQGVDSSNFSVSFDITVNGNYPWVEGYENTQSLHFWMKGVTIEAGYDAVNKQIYMRPANGGAFDEWVEDYELVEGQTYNFKVSAIFDDEAEWGGIYITIDGEDVIAYDDDNMFGVYYDMKLGEGNLDTIYFRNMGVAFTMDNLVVGSADFAWVDLAGDLDDNKAIDAADALTMRKYLAKVLGDADVDMTRMDVNGDDAINAKDQLAIRKALVA